MSTVVQKTFDWPGFSGISRMMIFGDSYSSVYDIAPSNYAPNSLHPLGVLFPGFTWNESGLPNWVGHLITKYCPPPRYIPGSDTQDAAYLERPLLVYDYAKGGDTVMGVQRQIQHLFLPNVGKKPDHAPWSSTNSLFITWVGINDCAYSKTHAGTIEKLFTLQQELYDAGARNFLFIDVPPIHQSPAVPKHREDSSTFDNYNSELAAGAHNFTTSHADATIMLFSASATFRKILRDPEAHGFKASDIRKARGSIWHDALHPTSLVHDHLAKDIAEFLGSVMKG